MFLYRIACAVHENAASLEDEYDIERLESDVDDTVSSGAAQTTM